MASSILLQCPDCSRLLYFASDKTTITTCTACGTVVWRQKDGTVIAKPQHKVNQITEIIQPGTTGSWNGKNFTVLGRFRAWFEEFVFNYWTIQFADGEIAWLGEGYGVYSILEAIPPVENVSSKSLESLNPGNQKELLPGKPFMLREKEQAVKWEIEGELFTPEPETSFSLFDFSAEDGSHISIFEWGKFNLSAYKVHYMPFSSLSLQQLREYKPSQRTFRCKVCSHQVAVKTYPYAQSCACAECGTCYDMKDGSDFYKDEKRKVTRSIHLPIGSTGIIDNISYEVIGYARKEELNQYHSQWTEYTLFNPKEGFAFLSEYEGNWMFVQEKMDSPVLLNQNFKEFTFDREPFHLFNSYNHKVVSARGEFPYNIFDNEKTKAREFISPPEMWIEERNTREGITWYFGRNMHWRKVKDAFGVSLMPTKRGTGAIEPTGFVNPVQMAMAALAGIILLVLVHMLINYSKEERVLINKAYTFPDSTNQISVVTEKFVFDKWRANVRFTIEAQVYNSWFELGATLVNVETGKEYSVEKGVEYYAGYSGGENWTEGSQKEVAYLTKIPAGTYFLQLQGTREASYHPTKPAIANFYLEVAYDVPLVRNLGWAVFLLLLWPAGKWMISNEREKQRWSNSPFSTYSS